MKSKLLVWPIAGALFVALFAAKASSQTLPSTPPSPAQAQQLLQNPSLAGRVQQMIQSSGLTPDQIRDRLKAQGYPEGLLDQYLSGGKTDSTATPGDDVFAAVRSLGLGDTTELKTLSTRAREKRRTSADSETAFLDTLKMAMQNDTIAAAIRGVLKSRADRQTYADSGFRVFGLDMFGDQTSQFDANTSGAVDPDYKFGPGDQLVLILTGDVEKSYPLRVTPSGIVVIPDVGALNVAGQTRAQFDDAFLRRDEPHWLQPGIRHWGRRSPE
jgi:polysaccharide export outer membrane protein